MINEEAPNPWIPGRIETDAAHLGYPRQRFPAVRKNGLQPMREITSLKRPKITLPGESVVEILLEHRRNVEHDAVGAELVGDVPPRFRGHLDVRGLAERTGGKDD